MLKVIRLKQALHKRLAYAAIGSGKRIGEFTAELLEKALGNGKAKK